MRKFSTAGRWMLGLSISGTIGFATAVLSAPAQAGPPVCPQVYAPVKCDNGKVYMNQCYADRARARNCVPYFEP